MPDLATWSRIAFVAYVITFVTVVFPFDSTNVVTGDASPSYQGSSNASVFTIYSLGTTSFVVCVMPISPFFGCFQT